MAGGGGANAGEQYAYGAAGDVRDIERMGLARDLTKDVPLPPGCELSRYRKRDQDLHLCLSAVTFVTSFSVPALRFGLSVPNSACPYAARAAAKCSRRPARM